MKKYIIPESMVVEPKGEIMIDIHNASGDGNMLGNDTFFDDLDDGMDNTFKTKRLWDDDEAR